MTARSSARPSAPACSASIEKLKNEIKASDTAVGVKIKDAFLLAVVVIVSTFGSKVLDLLSKAEADETEKAAQ